MYHFATFITFLTKKKAKNWNLNIRAKKYHKATIHLVDSIHFSKCECRDGEEQLVTNLGCTSGGVPRCRDTNNQVRNSSKSLIMPDPLFCNRRNSDQQRELKFWDLVEARFQDEDKQRCICRSNLFPVCQNGLPPRCPDGSKPLKSLTILPPFLDLCDHSDDWNKN